MISGKYKDTSALVHWLFYRQAHGSNLFTKSSNKDTPKRFTFISGNSFTAMVCISLDTSTQAISTLCTIILSTVIRAWLHLVQCSFSTPFLYSSRISSAIYFSWKFINSPLSLLTGIMDLGAAYLSLEERPQTFTEWSFFTQCCTASALFCAVDTTPYIDLSKERIDRSICTETH